MIDSSQGFVVEKVLSANDCGETGAHQAGALIPKDDKILNFFPRLNAKEKNPRCALRFRDDSGVVHRFFFIYYNSRLLGCGTRNEYRLTCMTSYIKSCNLKVGDVLLFSKSGEEDHVSYKRSADSQRAPEDGVILVKSGQWKVIKI